MPNEHLWPGLDTNGASLLVYAEDQVTVIPPVGGALVPLVRVAVGAPYTLPEYYALKKLAGELLTYDPLALSGDAIDVLPVTRTSASVVGMLAAELAATIGVSDGMSAECLGVAARGVGAGEFFWHAGNTDTAVTGMVLGATSAGRWKRDLSGRASVDWFGAVPDGVFSADISIAIDASIGTDSTNAIQAAFDSGLEELWFSPGVYRTTRQLFLRTNKTLSCDRPRGSAIVCDGTHWDELPESFGTLPHYAIVVNSASLASLAVQSVKSLAIRNLRIESGDGGGVFMGASVNPDIRFDNLYIWHCAGVGLLCAPSTYFLEAKKCFFGKCLGGALKAFEASDLLTLDSCQFWYGTGYDVDICTTTARIYNCDFELHTGTASGVAGEVAAHICVRSSAGSSDASGYGIIADNRFGPEVVGTAVPYCDIHFLNENAGVPAATVIRGMRLSNNLHFAWQDYHKEVPILLDAGVNGIDIQNPYVNGLGAAGATVGYASEYLVSTSDVANAVDNTLYSANFIDEMELVDPALQVIFQARVTSEIKYQRAVAAVASVTKFTALTSQGVLSTSGVRTVIPTVTPLSVAITALEFPDDIDGVALSDALVGKGLVMGTQGSLIVTTLDASALRTGDPVYLGAAGAISLTPHASFLKKVGRVISSTANATVQLDFSEPAMWIAMPTHGKWKKRQFAPKAVPVVAGAAASQYVITGWLRLTDGAIDPGTGATTNNVLNTDWVEVRTLTGT